MARPHAVSTRLWPAATLTLLLLGVAGLAPAADVAPLVKPLLAARERGEFGSIDGRAYAEGQRGGAAEQAAPQAHL